MIKTRFAMGGLSLSVIASIVFHGCLFFLYLLVQPKAEINDDLLRQKSIRGIFVDKSLLGGGVKKRNNPLAEPDILPIDSLQTTTQPLPSEPVRQIEPVGEKPEKTKELKLDSRDKNEKVEKKKPEDDAKKEDEKLLALKKIKRLLKQKEDEEEKTVAASQVLAVDDDDRPKPAIDNFEGDDPKKLPGRQGLSAHGEEVDQDFLKQEYTVYAQVQLMPVINKNWVYSNINIVKRFPDIHTQVLLKMDPKGMILLLSIDKASGIRDYDESCLRAIRRSEPLPIPPSSVTATLARVGIVLGFPGRLLLDKIGGEQP